MSMSNEELFIAYENATEKHIKDDLKEQLFVKNKNLAWHVSGKFMNTGIEKAELAAIALLGMVKAFNSFDSKKDILFTTYAIRCMGNEILMVLRKNHKHKGVFYLDNPIANDGAGNTLALVDTLEADGDGVGEAFEKRTLIKRILETAKQELTGNELAIFENRIKDDDGLNQAELAKKLGLSQSYVSRLERVVTQKVKAFAIQSKIIEPSEYSGAGIYKLHKKPTPQVPKKEEFDYDNPEASPVVTYKMSSPENKTEEEIATVDVNLPKIKEELEASKLRTVKEKVAFISTNYPEVPPKQVAEILGKSVGVIHTYKCAFNKEQRAKQSESVEKPEREPKELPVEVEEPTEAEEPEREPKELTVEVEEPTEVKPVEVVQEPKEVEPDEVKEPKEVQPAEVQPTITTTPDDSNVNNSPSSIDITMSGLNKKAMGKIFDLIYNIVDTEAPYDFHISMKQQDTK